MLLLSIPSGAGSMSGQWRCPKCQHGCKATDLCCPKCMSAYRPDPLTKHEMTFQDLPVGRYFVWARDPNLGVLMKCNSREAVDDSDVHRTIDPDEGVVL